MVNAVDLTTDCPTVGIVPVRRTFGQQDMYKDVSKSTPKDRMHMEIKLGTLENSASRIIARVVDAHIAGKDGISLSRGDKDILRKFLFVMKYRGPIFFARFNHDTADTYNSDDREGFLAYMKLRGFTRPLDVWFHNLLSIIDAPIDPAGEWIARLRETIYPPDADWLFMNIRTMHLAFVTPSDSDDEFILTGNAFGIHEGPVTFSVDQVTGKQTMRAYTEFHLLNVISSRLAMVLRHNSLPEPFEDVDPDVRSKKKLMLAAQASMHTDPDHATSLLEDLPVAKARNSYTVVNDGRLELAKGEDGKSRAGHTFDFVFFPLESRHAQMINTVMLDQAHNTSMLIFRSSTALRKALEFYLGHPAQAKGGHSIKTITDRKDDPMLLLFRKLEFVAQSLGSNVKAIYHVDPLDANNNPEHAAFGNRSLEDDMLSFDEAVAYALRTAQPGSSDHLIFLVMTVLVVVLTKTGMNIRDMYALDTMCAGDNVPTYPELVFRSVCGADIHDFNVHATSLLGTDVELWKMCWNALVSRALKVPGADARSDVKHMLEKFASQEDLDIADLPQRARDTVEARLSELRQSSRKQTTTTSTGTTQSSEIYKRRFDKLLEAMWPDLPPPESLLRDPQSRVLPPKFASGSSPLHNSQCVSQRALSVPPDGTLQDGHDRHSKLSQEHNTYELPEPSSTTASKLLTVILLMGLLWISSS